MASQSFLKLDSKHALKCLLCDHSIKKNDKSQKLGQLGWKTIQELAKEWHTLDIDLTDPRFFFRQAFYEIQDREEAFGIVHKNCRIDFTTKLALYKEKYKKLIDIEIADDPAKSDTASTTNAAEYTRTPRKPPQRACFICNEIRISDDRPYDEGGIGRCEQERSRVRMVERQDIYLSDV